MAVFGQHHVRGLEIAMDDALAVSARERFRHLDGDLDGAARRLRHVAVVDRGAQLVAADQLHGDEADAVFLADVVDDGDVGVLEGGGGARFADEPLAAAGVVGQLGG